MENNILLIVESPNKVATISSFLSNNYNVIATSGHLRELNKRKGYNENFEPIWEIINDKKNKISKNSIIKNIKSCANKSDIIYIATDPDREGEAIAWHIFDILDKKDQLKCKRITFNEITKNAVIESLNNSRDIDMNLVNSQFARRILDRIIGYKLSYFIKKSLNAISAGRVQSVALLFVVDRMLERMNFKPSKWFEIYAELDNGAKLTYCGENANFKKYESSSSVFKFLNYDDAKFVFDSLNNEFKLIKIDPPKLTKSDFLKPITTDKLLSLASSNFGWSAKKTTLIAQKMFEGINYNGQHIGLISYPRTDSERLSNEFIDESKKFIFNNFGNEYFNVDFNNKLNNKNQKNVQDAHEAIRPTNINLTPSMLKGLVDESTYMLYYLVWHRTLSALMMPPRFLKYVLHFDNNNNDFLYSYKEIEFKGYYVLDYYNNALEEYKNSITDMKLNNIYNGHAFIDEKDTLPPPLYTEATLISALKDSGVGRPSTYSKMASIGDERGYTYKEKNKILATDFGIDVINELKKDFNEIISPQFTSLMEEKLDLIASGNLNWQTYMNEFVPQFNSKMDQSIKNITKINYEITDEICPQCGENKLVIRQNKYGNKFIGCFGYPKCKYTKSLDDDQLDELCPQCNHKLLIKTNRKKQKFIGCSNYPQCKFIKNINN